MRIDEVTIGQRVRITPAAGQDGGAGADGPDECAVAGIDQAARHVKGKIADGAAHARVITVPPEQLEPADSASAQRDHLARKRWWERVVEAGSSIPLEERKRIPSDAPENRD